MPIEKIPIKIKAVLEKVKPSSTVISPDHEYSSIIHKTNDDDTLIAADSLEMQPDPP